MRNAICARVKTKHQNQWKYFWFFFLLIFSCETHWYEWYTRLFYFAKEKKTFQEAIENSAQTEKLVSIWLEKWKKITKAKSHQLSNVIMAFLNMAKVFDVMRLFHFSAIRLPIYGLLRSTTTHHHSKCYWNISVKYTHSRSHSHSNSNSNSHVRLRTLTIHIVDSIESEKEKGKSGARGEKKRKRVCVTELLLPTLVAFFYCYYWCVEQATYATFISCQVLNYVCVCWFYFIKPNVPRRS